MATTTYFGAYAAPGPAGPDAPTITSFTPTTAAVNTTLTLTGTKLLNITAVTIGGVAAALPSAGAGTGVDGTRVTLLVPAGADTGLPISITTTKGTATSAQVLKIAKPLAAPSGGQAVAETPGSLHVTAAPSMGGATGYQLFGSDTTGTSYKQVGGTLTGPNYVETGLGFQQQRYYRWKALGNGDDILDSPFSAEFSGITQQGDVVASPPTIDAVPAAESRFGDTQTITGQNFIGVTAVTINEVPVASFIIISATQARLTVSPAQTTGLLKITTAAGTGVSDQPFLVAAATVNQGITRLDVTVDFNAVNNTTKTPATVMFSNGYGSNYAARHLYGGSAMFKIRGNSTSTLPKKPFSLTLAKGDGSDQKFPALGMYNDSDFVLLAEYQDPTYLRTYISQEISRAMGLVTVQTRPIELYINGEYYGLYTITEKVKQTSVGLETLSTAGADQVLPQASGGYLFQKQLKEQLETDDNPFDSTYYNDSYTDIRISRATCVTVDYPKSTKITPTQFSIAKQFVLDAEATLTKGWLDEDAGPQTMFDKDSLLKYYLVSEFCQSLDAERTSYFYKKRNGKLMHGPLWDTDISFVTYTFYAFLPNHPAANYIWSSNGWCNKFFADRYFRNDLSKLYVSTGKAAIQQAVALLPARTQLLVDSGAQGRNNARWGVNTTQYVVPISTGVATDNYQDHVQFLQDFISARFSHFDTTYVPLNLIGTPVGGYIVECVDYVQYDPTSPNRFDGRNFNLPNLPAQQHIKIFAVASKPISQGSTQTLLTISLPSDDPDFQTVSTRLLYNADHGFGENLNTAADYTLDDPTIFNRGGRELLEVDIYNNNTTGLTIKINGVEQPMSTKPAGADIPNKPFGTDIRLGVLDFNRPFLNWQGAIGFFYVYYGLSEVRCEAERKFLRDNSANLQ